MGEVIIVNKKEFDEKVERIKKDGVEKLHILSDFDRTITTAFVNGESRPSLISVLRDGNYLTKEYAEKAHELFNKYHPIEIDPKLSLEEKKKAMKEWWETHFELLLKEKLNKKDIERVIKSEKVQLREGVKEFLDLLKEEGIPLVILSSTGLGGDAIIAYLKNAEKLYPNIHIIANFFKWAEDGRAIEYSKPVIHTMNKDETVITKFPKIYGNVEKRKNVILLGDTHGDPGMIVGFDYEVLIKIGFLNDKEKELMESYKQIYDVIIIGDGNFSFINKLMKEIIG